MSSARQTMSSRDEKELIDAVEQVIAKTAEGVDPTAAVAQVAGDRQFGPEHMRRMAEALNKSKSYFEFQGLLKKEGGSDTFPTADAEKAIGMLYPEIRQTEKAAAGDADFALPPDLSSVCAVFPFHGAEQDREKTASPAVRQFSPSDARVILTGFRKAHDELERKLSDKVAAAWNEMLLISDQVCERAAGLSDREFRKFAQRLVNGIPVSGESIVRLICEKTGKRDPGVEKTANAAVFPVSEPYVSVEKLHEVCVKTAAAEMQLDQFHKHAITVNDMMTTLNTKNVGKALRGDQGSLEDMLSAENQGKLQEIDARRAFMNAILYDPVLSAHSDYMSLVRAFNDAVGMVPAAVQRPTLLRNMMLNNLAGSGQKDPFRLKTEADVGEALSKTDLNRQTELAKVEGRLRPTPDKPERPAE